MTAADGARWLAEYQRLHPVLRRIEQQLRATLTASGLPSTPEAAVARLDAGAWPARITSKGKHRIRLAIHGLLWLRQVRAAIGPAEINAPAAAYAALQAGACAADALLGELATLGAQAQSARRQGGRARADGQATAGRQLDAQIRRGYRQWSESDELQAEYRTVAAYIQTLTGQSRTAIYRRLKKLTKLRPTS